MFAFNQFSVLLKKKDTIFFNLYIIPDFYVQCFILHSEPCIFDFVTLD